MGFRRAPHGWKVPGAPGILLTKIYKLLTKRDVPYRAGIGEAVLYLLSF